MIAHLQIFRPSASSVIYMQERWKVKFWWWQKILFLSFCSLFILACNAWTVKLQNEEIPIFGFHYFLGNPNEFTK